MNDKKEYNQIDLFSVNNPEFKETQKEEEPAPQPEIPDKYKGILIW